MGDDDKIQLRGALDDPEKLRAVDLRSLVYRVDLDAFQTEIFDPGEFRPEIRMIRVDAAEREEAVRPEFFIYCRGGIVHVAHLAGRGGHRKDHGAVDAAPPHILYKTCIAPVRKRPGVGNAAQSLHGLRRDLVRKRVGMDIDNHFINLKETGDGTLSLSLFTVVDGPGEMNWQER